MNIGINSVCNWRCHYYLFRNEELVWGFLLGLMSRIVGVTKIKDMRITVLTLSWMQWVNFSWWLWLSAQLPGESISNPINSAEMLRSLSVGSRGLLHAGWFVLIWFGLKSFHYYSQGTSWLAWVSLYFARLIWFKSLNSISIANPAAQNWFRFYSQYYLPPGFKLIPW